WCCHVGGNNFIARWQVVIAIRLALWPLLGYNPVRYNIDVHSDHGDCCICHELGRYLTRKARQSFPPAFSIPPPSACSIIIGPWGTDWGERWSLPHTSLFAQKMMGYWKSNCDSSHSRGARSAAGCSGGRYGIVSCSCRSGQAPTVRRGLPAP